MSKKMFRYEIPVDDREHERELQGEILHVEGKRTEGWDGWDGWEHSVEFWAEGSLEGTGVKRTFFVVGTGHPVPEGTVWRGTTARLADGLVWHLYERMGEA